MHDAIVAGLKVVLVFKNRMLQSAARDYAKSGTQTDKECIVELLSPTSLPSAIIPATISSLKVEEPDWSAVQLEMVDGSLSETLNMPEDNELLLTTLEALIDAKMHLQDPELGKQIAFIHTFVCEDSDVDLPTDARDVMAR